MAAPPRRGIPAGASDILSEGSGPVCLPNSDPTSGKPGAAFPGEAIWLGSDIYTRALQSADTAACPLPRRPQGTRGSSPGRGPGGPAGSRPGTRRGWEAAAMFIHALHSISSEAVGGPSSEVKLNPGVFLKIPPPAGDFLETKANPFNLLLKLIICSARRCRSLPGKKARGRLCRREMGQNQAGRCQRESHDSDSQTRSSSTQGGGGAHGGAGLKTKLQMVTPSQQREAGRPHAPSPAGQTRAAPASPPVGLRGHLGPGCLPGRMTAEAGQRREVGRGLLEGPHTSGALVRGSTAPGSQRGPRCARWPCSAGPIGEARRPQYAVSSSPNGLHLITFTRETSLALPGQSRRGESQSQARGRGRERSGRAMMPS